MQPEGDIYNEWMHAPPDMHAENISDPDLDAEALDLLRRVARLAPLYQGGMPTAAVLLDHLVDTGHLPFLFSDDAGTIVSIEEIVERYKSHAGSADVRESVHRLHAAGALLLVIPDGTEQPMVRMVARPPLAPGDKWVFVGDPEEAALPKVCLPPGVRDLTPEVASAVMYMRAMQAQLREPDPEEFSQQKGVESPEHARALFAEARRSGQVDHKGCEACPAGHLCTRPETE
jgi:hypothetical protein